MLLLAVAALASDSQAWQSATLIETHHEEGTPTSDVYTLDSGEKLLVCRQVHWYSDKPLDLEVGRPVQYSRSGRNVIVRDNRGKEHKLTLERESLK